MNMLLISASPRKARSQTFALARAVAKGARAGARIDIVHLRDLRIDYCTHCEACHVSCMHCPIKDDVHRLLDKMLAADGIILATPNYINQVTAALKAVLDRSSHFIHCKRLLGKYLCGVVTSGSGAQDDIVLDYLGYYAHVCGAQYSGGVSAAAYAVDAKRSEAVKLGRRLAQDIATKKQYPAQLKIIEQGRTHFRTIIELRRKHWLGEYQYWKQRDWL